MKYEEVKVEKPIFIIGAPRSGTTLIADLIAFHEDLGWFSNYFAAHRKYPAVSILNRLVDIPKIGHLLRGKEVHRKRDKFKEKLPYPREAYSIWDLYTRPDFSKDYLMGQKPSGDEKRNITGVIHKVLGYQCKNRFFNKMTGPARIGYLSGLFPDACYVHIIRDPRAVVSSLLKVNFWVRNGGLDAPWWQNGLREEYLNVWKDSGRNPAVLAAVQWRQIIENARHETGFGTHERKKYIEIKYETFLEDPENTINEILKFCGLTKSNKVYENLKKRVRIKNMNYKFHDNLSHEDIDAVESVTRFVSKKLGYQF
ncbi:MAG: sulfotransferase [Desulfobacteraceae bacterium]|nr:sulfotransferase [Desulfobacteraceae bacterium]